ncbi:MAG: autotransporter outer membrane beta-barrel domain-containing protein [Candidatus Accumulibacter sp.]|jgi:hypothetical protein|nr:autotransporter outer membrane beta-barrel domain-containing protein [Accumulibacter sp.]
MKPFATLNAVLALTLFFPPVTGMADIHYRTTTMNPAPLQPSSIRETRVAGNFPGIDPEHRLATGQDDTTPPGTIKTGQDDFFTALDDDCNRRGNGACSPNDGRNPIADRADGSPFDTNRFTLDIPALHGESKHDTHSDFIRAVKTGNGKNTEYTGLGLLARLLDLGENDARSHAESSMRARRTKAIFYSQKLRDAAGRGARYDTHATYIGLHLGVGRVWNVQARNKFAFYGKYLYARLGSDSVRLGTGGPVKFDAIESRRLRFGGRYSWMLENDTNPYLGLAWEHEFDGRTDGRRYGLPLDAPNVREDTHVVELGVSLYPTLAHPLSIELGIRGYGDKYESTTGSLRMEYRF